MATTAKPVLSESNLGVLGWGALHEEAFKRGRRPADQAIALVRYGLYQLSRGVDVELSQRQLNSLLDRPALESVA